MPNDSRRHRIAAAFDAAKDYDDHAYVQREVARRLADRLFGRPFPRVPRILEIGCGTGFLTQELISQFPMGRLTCTDIAPRMLLRAAARVGSSAADFRLLDGQEPDLGFQVDLVASSLAFQWFDKPDQAIGRIADLVLPGGVLAFATPAQGTFREWRAIHQEVGLSAGILRFPESGWFRGCFDSSWQVEVDTEELRIEYGSAREFLKTIRGVGATVPEHDYPGLRPHELRRLLARCDLQPRFPVTWEVAFVVATKAQTHPG